MKKFLNIFLIVSIFCLSFLFVGCGSYNPSLTKDFSANGFAIKTTDDFELVTTCDGIKLKSEGDGQVSFNDTFIIGQYDMGNEYFDVQNTTLSKYVSDMAKVERLSISTPIKTLTIKEKISDQLSIDVSLDMYVVCQNQNPNGNYDFYSILFFGKAQNSFIYFNIYTTIQDDYYEQNIKKYSAIISSVELTSPQPKTYDSSVTSYISSTMMTTDDYLAYWKFKFTIPNNYWVVEYSANYYNYLTTTYGLEWGSSIRCSNLAMFFDNVVLDDDGARHFINFSKDNLLGFYTMTKPSESEVEYKIYHFNANNTLNRNYITITVGSEQLDSLGFLNYFEEQMFDWIQNIEVLP